MKTQTYTSLFLILCFCFSTLSAQIQVQIGEGELVTDNSVTSPVNIWYRSLRCQIVYTVDELNAQNIVAGNILKLGFYINSAPAFALPNYSIKMKHTSQTDVTSHDDANLTEVYLNPSYAPIPGGFELLTLDEPFFWNGIDNILIDVCFDQTSSYNSSGTVRYYEYHNGFRFIRSDGASQCNLETNSLNVMKPQIMFEFASFAENDAGISKITAPVQFCAGSHEVKALLTNYGSETLENVTLNWSVNNVVQTAINYDTPLASSSDGTNQIEVSLGSFNFAESNQYIVSAWTSNPNNTSDGFAANDTISSTIAPGLNGTYTLGGSSPDFDNFTSLAHTLNNFGVCGPTIINVRNGTYNEQIELLQIPGADETHTVKIQSESGDSSLVVLTHNSDFNSNYTLQLRGTKWLTIQNITIEATNTSNGRAVVLLQGAKQNTFKGNYLSGISTSFGSTSTALVYAPNQSIQSNSFYNNFFDQGFCGIYYDASFTTHSNNIIIHDNQFSEQGTYGIYLNYTDSISIKNNVFHSATTNSFYYGMWLSNASLFFDVSSNRLFNIDDGRGIYLSNVNGTESQKAMVYNNFVHILGDQESYGIYTANGTHQVLAYNSVNIKNTHFQSRAFFNSFGSEKTLLNNIFANSGGGYSIFVSGTSSFSTSNYNDLYTTGEKIGAYDNTDYTSLENWTVASTLDSNSVSEIPLYISDTSYQLVQIALNGIAKVIPSISTDIEGNIRNMTNPDVGAYEFDPPAIDAGLTEIGPTIRPFDSGNQSIQTTLKNFGIDPITSVTINWQIDGVNQTPINWMGNISSDEVENVALGTVNFNLGQSVDLKAWTSNPNNTIDYVLVNDTASVSDLYAGLNGAYTIGGSGPDFATIGDAIQILNLGGAVDEVTFNIRPGNYTEQVTLLDYPGADQESIVSFQSETQQDTDVVISFNSGFSNNYILLLDGAKWLQFKNLTFRPLNTFYSRAIEIQNRSENLMFDNVIFDGQTSTSTSSSSALIFASDERNSNISISECTFNNAGLGIYINGSFSNPSENITLQNNLFKNQYYRSVLLQYIDSVVVHQNTVQSNTAYNFYYGIALSDCEEEVVVTSNQVFNIQNGRGMYLYDLQGTEAQPVLIANNFVQIGGDIESQGIYSAYGSYQNIVYNTVNVTNSHESSSAFYNNFGNNRYIYNNIFSNRGDGYAIYISNLPAIQSSDYNDLYSSGDHLAHAVFDIDNLADWRTSTGFEEHSLSEDPRFVSDTSYQHTQIALNDAAMPLTFVTTDIDGEPRHATHPDIGADEFVPPPIDAGVATIQTSSFPFPSGNQSLYVIVKNFGTENLGNLNIQWSVNETQQETKQWSGALFSNDTVKINLGTIDFEIGQAYQIKAWSENPNNQADQVAANDTAKIDDLYAGLGGEYSIGVGSFDFNSFEHAVTTLNFGGVVAPVQFNIAAGVYNEQVQIKDYPGADSSRVVTFQSASADSISVVLSHLSDFNKNYTLLLDEASWLVFKHITIEATANFYARAISFTDGAHHISFYNNVLKGKEVTSTANSNAIVYADNGLNEYISFKNNHFIDGSSGLYLVSSYNNANYNSGTIVSNNLFTNQYWAGMYLRNQSFLEAKNNQVETNSNYFSYIGIYLVSCYHGGTVSENIVSKIDKKYGIYLSDCSGNTTDPFLVSNNFVHVTAAENQDVWGIFTSSGNEQMIAYNSVHIQNTNAQSRAFYNSFSSNLIVLNNIFSNSGGGYAYYNSGTTGIPLSNHNNLYTTGAVLGYWATDVSDLSNWKSVTAQDSSSLSVDPVFTSASDLHTTSVNLDKAGFPLAEVPFDIDGETRDPVKPDIGADEFSTSANDAGILSVNTPTIPFAANLQEIYVTLFNNGLDSLKNVTLNWSVNGLVQTPSQYNEILISGQSMDSILIGSYTFELDTMYSISAWTSLPNGMIDEDTFNDTASLDSLYAGLGGVYTIGGMDPDFPDFTQATNALINGGIVNPVVFNVRPGTYDEQISIPEINGASQEYSITFQSENQDSTGVTLATVATNDKNYTLKLDGADWLQFKHLTIQANDPTYGRVIEISNQANNNVFKNNILKAQTVNSSDTRYSIIYSSSSVDQNNEFQYNRLEEGSYGFYYNGQSNAHEEGTIISNNQLINQYYYSIYFIYQRAPLVHGNEIVTNTNTSNYIGIYGNTCSQNIRISGNYIHDIGQGIGIRLENSTGNIGNEALVYNQFVQIGTDDNYSQGIQLRSTSNIKIYYNSVHVTSNSSTSAAFRAENSGSNVRLLNNNLVNSGGGLSYFNNNVGINISNHNNLYSTGTILGSWNGTELTNLIDWKASTALDANSISKDPTFASNNDLHVEEIDLNANALAVAEVLIDFDGELRDEQHPDIGADEFHPIVENDILVSEFIQPSSDIPFPDGEQDVLVAIKNNGSNLITTAAIQWKINNITQSPVSWSGSLMAGERDTVKLGTFNFVIGVGHDILAFTENPNGLTDLQPSNDTLIATGLFAALSGDYTIGGQFPDFNTLGEAVSALNKGGVLGAVNFNIRNGIYGEQVVLKKAKGISEQNSVSFQSESGQASSVTIEHNHTSNAGNYLIRFDGAQYTHLKNLSLQATNGSYATIVEFMNGASYNHLTNNILRATNNQTANLISSDASSINAENEIINNEIINGGYGMYLVGRGSSILETGYLISGNKLTNQKYGGIYLKYHSNFDCIGNEINSNTDYSSYKAIYLQRCDLGFRVSKNNIWGSIGHGIWLDRCESHSSSPGLISNNFVHVKGSLPSYGIYLYSGIETDLIFNNIHVTNSNVNSSAFYNAYGEDKDVINNILANSGGGYAYFNNYSYSGSIASSNFNNLYSTGANLGYWSGTNAGNLSAWKSVSGKDNSSLSEDPLFTSETDLHVFQARLDSMAIPIAQITEDIDGDLRDVSFPDIGADEFSYILDDVGIAALVQPSSGCELGSQESITIEIQNFSGLTLSGFDVAVKIGDQTPIIENIGSLAIAPGVSKNYTFSGNFDLSEVRDYQITAYTIFPDDTNASNDEIITTVSNLNFPATPANLIPSNGSSGLSNRIAFSWSPSEGATEYDLFVWPANESKPEIPSASDIVDISYLYYNSSLIPGDMYGWQIIAKNDYCSTDGPVQTFSLFDLPDLVVTDVQIPDEAFSGREVELDWTVQNMGDGHTGMTQWIDAVYLSDDAILDLDFDTYLGGTGNATALNSEESYSGNTMVTLPEGISGTYYLFIWTDSYNRVKEELEDNNTGRSFGEMTITLTPPPDLRVTSIVSPNNTFSGSEFNINWTVTNTGAGNTRSTGWTDKVYLFDNDTLDINAATFLGQHQFNNILQVDSSYTKMITGIIPNGISGEHFIHVVTDFFNQEYEFASEANNTSVSTPINIVLTPPPDLVVTSIVVPSIVANSETVSIDWTVQNQGGSEASGNWQDKIYLSMDASSPDLDQATHLATRNRLQNLNLGEEYTNSLTFIIPHEIAGPYYIYVVTDANDQIFEFTNEGNNTTGSTQILVNTPDLEVNTVNISVSEAESGDSISVNWNLKNNGPGDLTNRDFETGIYVSASTPFNIGSSIQVFAESSAQSLNTGESISRHQKVLLPNGISGQYYVYVFADSKEQVFENSIETNNVNASGTGIVIELAPWVDLNPILINSADTVNAGALVSLNYTIENSGTKNGTALNWNDRLFISATSIWDPKNATLLQVLNHQDTINVGESVMYSQQILIPLNLLTGNFYIHLLVDYDNHVFEYTGESNNRVATSAILVTGYPPIDFKVEQVMHNVTVNTGEKVTVGWTVKNDADNPSISSSWTDAIFLSSDATFDRNNDILLAEKKLNGIIVSGADYSDQANVIIPNGLSGNFYLIVVADFSNAHNDFNRNNNVGYTKDEQGNVIPMEVVLTPPPDLVVSAFNVAPQATAGQPIEINWKVENKGTGPTTSGEWIDRIYLSTDFVLDSKDRILGSVAHKGVLASGENYLDTTTITIPIATVGNRILIIKTDVNNTVFEFESEGNNTANASIEITEAPPSDLQIINIITPVSAKAGEVVNIQWTLKNEGENPASGYMQEAIYFSKDNIWDIQDVLIGKETLNINLAPQITLNRSLMANLSGVAVGDFYVIIRTDVLNNITESDDTNNLKVSETTVKVDVEEIFIGQLKLDTMENNKEIFYRIEIGSELIGESLLTTLVGDTITGNNELYLRYGDIPSRVDFDFAFGESFSGRQEVIIPELKEGTYYILAYGNSFSSTEQNVEILAKILNFEIRRVNDNMGGNNGNVTVRIDGSKFEEGMQIRLENSTSIPAYKVEYIDPTRVYATFDLTDKPLGKFDVVAEKQNGETTTLPNAFEVVLGTAPSIATNITHPATTRPNRIVTLRVDFTNDGSIDVKYPKATLRSLRGAPIALTLEDLDKNETTLDLDLLELNGPPDVLRPGASGTITVYVKSTEAIVFVLVLSEFL